MTAVRNVLWVAVPKVLGGGAQLVLTLALLRRLPPHSYGIVSVCLSGVLLSDSIFGGATDSGVLRLAPSENSSDPLRSVQFQQAGLVLKFLLANCIVVPALLFATRISQTLFQTRAGWIALCISVAALFGMLMLRSVEMHFQVNERFAAYGLCDLASSLLEFGGIGGLLVFAQFPRPEAILALYAAGSLVVACGVLLSSARVLMRAPFSQRSLRELFAHVKWYLATSTTGTVLSRMDVFLVSSLAGVANAGLYAGAQAIALVPQLIGSYIAVVFSPRIMPMFEAGTLRPLYLRFQLAISGFAVFAFLLAAFAGPRVYGMFFPASFHSSVAVVLVLLPSGLCALVNFPFTVLLLLFTRPRFLIALDCIFLPVLLVAYRVAIANHGVQGAAWVTTIAALVKTIVLQVYAWRLLRHGTCTQTLVRNAPVAA